VRQGYGLTEATFSTIDAPLDTTVEQRLVGTVGRATPGVAIRIADEGERALPPGAIGEVLIRGPNLMAGYLEDAEATRAAITEGGWLRTGDLGRLDEEGRLTIVDRKKDLILRGGHNVYPAEVEAQLAVHPAVAGAFVFGRPDPHYGETVAVAIVPRPDVVPSFGELSAWLRERLSAHKVPTAWGLIDAAPLGPSGKVQKRRLKELVESGALVLTDS
jgi:long-chain acyl-CoA synthetase